MHIIIAAIIIIITEYICCGIRVLYLFSVVEYLLLCNKTV